MRINIVSFVSNVFGTINNLSWFLHTPFLSCFAPLEFYVYFLYMLACSCISTKPFNIIRFYSYHQPFKLLHSLHDFPNKIYKISQIWLVLTLNQTSALKKSETQATHSCGFLSNCNSCFLIALCINTMYDNIQIKQTSVISCYFNSMCHQSP